MEKNECAIKDVLDVLSKKWALLILKELSINDKKRFNELLKSIKGISPRSLSKRLKELESSKLIKKEIFKEIPPRVEYSLTKQGKELVKCFTYLNNWIKRWDIRPNKKNIPEDSP